MASTTLTIRTDPATKQQAQALAGQLGLPLSSILNAFLKQFVRDGGAHFSITTEPPRQQTAPASPDRRPRQLVQRLDPDDPTIDWLGDSPEQYAGQVVETTVLTIK